MVRDTLRVWDANLNRAREGLRVLEEAARFLLDDKALAERIKALRHTLATDSSLTARLLSHRRASEDVAAFADLPTELERRDWLAVVLANAKRTQESLRVLEELEKLPDAPWKTSAFKEGRFALYELEKELVGKLLRGERAARLRGLYAIIDPEMSLGRSIIKVAQEAIAGGASVLQLRDKIRPKGEVLAEAQEIRNITAQANVLFIVNDHPDLALAADADGVHLGQKDLPIAVARRILPIDRLVGCSANTLAEAQAAVAQGADYLGVGSVFPTATKADARPGSLDVLRQIKAAVPIPLVAIGGINADNIAQVMQAGADAAAVVSAICGAPDVVGAARNIVEAMEVLCQG